MIHVKSATTNSYKPKRNAIVLQTAKGQYEETTRKPFKQVAPVMAEVGECGSCTTKKTVKQVYDVVVNQLATTRKDSSSMIPSVQPYAIRTVPASKVPRVNAYAVFVLPGLPKRPFSVDKNVPVTATDASRKTYKYSKFASGDHAYDTVK